MLHDISSSFFIFRVMFVSQKLFTDGISDAVTATERQVVWRHKKNLFDY